MPHIKPPRLAPIRRGFTLLELVCVIVLVGALGAIAMQSFLPIATQANTAKAQSVGAAIETASIHNQVSHAMGRADAIVVNSGGTTLCTKAWSELMLGAPLPSGINFRIVAGISCSTPAVPFMRCVAMSTAADGTFTSTPYKVYCAGN